jgi:hypothetical protein
MESYHRLPKITGSTEIDINKQVYTSTHDGEVPKEMADYSQQVKGDGQARVAVSADMAFKDYGNGVSVSVTLSLSCNQDDQTVNNVVQTLSGWSREYCKQSLALARVEYEKMKS